MELGVAEDYFQTICDSETWVLNNRGRTTKLGGVWGHGEAKQLLHNKTHMGIMVTNKGNTKTRDWNDMTFFTNNSSHYRVANVSRRENVNGIIRNS